MMQKNEEKMLKISSYSFLLTWENGENNEKKSYTKCKVMMNVM